MKLGLTQCYLEIARCAFTSIDFTAIDRKEETERTPIVNVAFAVVSTSIIYSHMAIESFVNYQLYRIWERRNSGAPESGQFNSEFPNINEFIKLKNHKSIRELGERIKTICRVLNYKQIHEAILQLWLHFCVLTADAQHYLIHPVHDPNKFDETIRQILENNRLGLYVKVAEEIIEHLYNEYNEHNEPRINPPSWLHENRLFKSRGFELLADKN